MAEYHLTAPLSDQDVCQLTIGDLVYFRGEAFTGRSLVHRRVFAEGHPLPFSTVPRNVLIHVGPVVVSDATGWHLTAFNPTSSIQVDKWGPDSVREWGLKAIIGKTTMGRATMAAMRAYKCVHVTPIGIATGLFVEQLAVRGVHWLDELGSIEAAWLLEMKDFGPFLVDIDTEGRNYFDLLDRIVEQNKGKAYQRMGIPEDFECSKLY